MSKTPRIGYLSAGLRVSTRPNSELVGPRAHVVGIITAFENLGWQVTRFIVGDQIPLRVTRQAPSDTSWWHFWRQLLIDLTRVGLGFINSLRALRCIGQDVELVYERLATLQCLGWIFKRYRLPWILETNAILHQESSQERNRLILTPIARWIERYAYRHCDLIVCVSDSLKELVIEDAGVPAEKVIVLHNGVNTAVFDPAQATARRLWEGFTIGFVGELYAWYALDFLMDVVQDIRQTNADLYLTLVGDGDMRHEWEQYSRHIGLQDAVRFVGHVTWGKVPDYIAGFDIGYFNYVLKESTKRYGDPIKVYEYMAMAKPVLAVDYEVTRQVVQPGKTGYLFTMGDRESLKNAILNAYQERDELSRIGLRAREEVIANHRWENRVQQLIAFISQQGLLKSQQETDLR